MLKTGGAVRPEGVTETPTEGIFYITIQNENNRAVWTEGVSYRLGDW